MVVVPETTSKEWLFWLQTVLDADKACQTFKSDRKSVP